MPEQRNGTAGGARPGKRTTFAVACVLGVLAGPVTAGTAYADPSRPQPSPGIAANEPDPDRTGGGATAADGPAPGADGTASGEDAGESAPGAGQEPTLEQVRKKIEDLHHRAGSATDAYNAAEEKVDRQRKQIASLTRKIESTEQKLDRLKQQAGAMARAQYRSGGLPDGAQLMLAEDPENFLHEAGLARQGRQAAKSFLASLTNTKKRLDGYAEDATERWKKLEKNRKKKAAAKKNVKAELKKAERLESRLAADEREKLRELERQAAYARQLRWLRSGVLEEIDGEASAQGKKAIRYATAQVGKDYEWGAEGPKTYDCSGLTMRAWQAAGEAVPRTSQEQWKQLPRVPVEEMRPGDLIIYKEDASHVGMYVGDGAMVHAPRTGRQITVEGAGSLPILGVVRPDGE